MEFIRKFDNEGEIEKIVSKSVERKIADKIRSDCSEVVTKNGKEAYMLNFMTFDTAKKYFTKMGFVYKKDKGFDIEDFKKIASHYDKPFLLFIMEHTSDGKELIYSALFTKKDADIICSKRRYNTL